MLPLPSTLTPTKVASFTDCALAFRFAVIDRVPEPPTVATVKGTLVHAALEGLFGVPPAERTPEAATAALDSALARLRLDQEFVDLALDPDGEGALVTDAAELLRQYFRLEDPRSVHPIGLELKLEAEVGGVRLRGVIDRLELDAAGELVVTDYKTGRAPAERYEQGRFGGVHVYALLCERLFGRRPAAVQLLYLADPLAIVCRPSQQSSRAIEQKVGAVWKAVERACARDDFRPRPSKLCDYCAFRQYCPAFGGDPEAARAAAAAVRAPGAEVPVVAA
jgi:putative RecB family exonuclease